MTFLNLHELEALARPCLAPAVFDYFAGGALDEITLGENRRAYDRLFLRPRVLVDVRHRDASTALFGDRFQVPILVAPMALQAMAHADAELGTARAATTVGAGLVLSTLSSLPPEDVRSACTPAPWYQLYVHQDHSVTEAILARVAAAGFSTLVLTVDTPVLGRRERDVRNAFQPPPSALFASMATSTSPESKDSALARYFAARHDAGVTWKDLDWLRQVCGLRIVLKGVVRGDDARKAIDHGVDGVIVSNHGGRQLDTTVPTIRALPDVAGAVGGRIPVLVDGGIRRGADVLKALALGARAVLVGRPILWGLALGGEAGVQQVLSILRDELDTAMALCGCTSLADVTDDLVESGH
jgi:4-hydroxymandelate oxidase